MTPIADDYAAIRSRLAEIEAGEREDERNDPVCFLCSGSGWMLDGMTPQGPIAAVCEACGNPDGKACP